MRVNKHLEEDKIIKGIEEASLYSGCDTYLVGGFVRDLLLDIHSRDYDVVIKGDLREFTLKLAKLLNATDVKFHPLFTATIVGTDYRVDIAHMRRERYPKPAALPEVEKAFSIEEDLSRRDFTINAMAVPLTGSKRGEVIDLFGGIEDLKRGIVRVIKDRSFEEDPTRAFRAVRYRVRFSFEYHPSMEREFKFAKRFMNELTFDRIKTELIKITAEDKAPLMWMEVIELGLLEPVLKLRKVKFQELLKVSVSFEGLKGPRWLFYLLYLLEEPESLLEKNLTKEERNLVRDFLILKKHFPYIPQSVEEMHKIYGKRSDPSVLLHALLYEEEGDVERVLDYLKKRKSVIIFLRGEEIMKLGFKGKEIGRAKELLYLEKLKGHIKTKEDEVRFLEKLKRN